MKCFTDETIGKIRQGYYSAVYFNRTKEILLKEKILKQVTMQVFQKKEGSILCGVEEVKELLRMATGYFEDGVWQDKSGELEIKVLKDGDKLDAWETAIHISGPYAYFANLESIYLGILARRTWIATNTGKCVQAAGGKPVIFFGDRFDHFLNQEGDGYAANIGGAFGVCTEAQTAGIGGDAIGTIPHSLIALTDGKIEEAAGLFYKYYPQVNLIALVDFDNDCVNTTLSVARKMGDKLWGVRLDTSAENIDKSLQNRGDTPVHRSVPEYMRGVNPELVGKVRNVLDREGFNKVKIVVSGGFYPDKIKRFSDEKVPVDAYGVGSAIVHGDNDFTADIVEVDGKPMAKAGREYKPINSL